MNAGERVDHPAWPARAAILAALGAAFGLAFHALLDDLPGEFGTDDPFRTAAAAFLAVSGIVFAFALERGRWTWSAAFAAGGGLVAAFVAASNGNPQLWGAGEGWQFFAGLLSVAIALPLFQAIRDSARGRPETAIVHAHIWTNLILWGAACAFVAATVLLTLLLAALFALIGIDFLKGLIEKGGFTVPLACAAFGGAVGLLRDRDQVLGILQKVARAVLSVLAPVLAVGLVSFVAALPFTGLQPLWDETRATTPILLACIVGAIFLVNAVVGNDAEEESRSLVLRWAAIGLAVATAPLAFVAMISTAKRIGQYGLTPDRLWACVFVFAATAFALVYLYGIVRGRAAWPEALRRSNVRLAAGLCLLALFLALPIVNFGAISARDQLARLESGAVAPERFDWGAMRFDFGPAGRRGLERLAAAGRPELRALARRALAAEGRHDLVEPVAAPVPAPPLTVVVDRGAPVPEALRRALENDGACVGRPCRLLFAEPDRAVVLSEACALCPLRVQVWDLDSGGSWIRLPDQPPGVASGGRPPVPLSRRKVEVRTVEHRQVFVDGRPMGPAFD